MELVQQDYSEDQDATNNLFPSNSWIHGQDCSPSSSRCTDYNQAMDLSLGSSSTSKDVVEREHMFDKVVTPSDVGKLNRLVIPKQHAEKYFPLDSSTQDKGLLLNFEDRSGKPWRFRYSYWNSSQSYVMTKGWSRFVKDKKLDAGDIVSFHRGLGDHAKDRLFIDWRRRPQNPLPRWTMPLNMPPPPHHYYLYHQPHLKYNYSNYHHNHPYFHRQLQQPAPEQPLYSLRSDHYSSSLAMQQRGHVPMVFDSVPWRSNITSAAAAVGKNNKLRLFGVNMECGMATEDEDPNSRRVSEKGKSSLSFDLDL